MEQLTPELERRLQVEELWARRNVLCDSINESRRERFRTRHQMLSRLGTQALPLPVHVVAQALETAADAPIAQMAAPQPMRPDPLNAPSGAFRALRLAGFAAAAALLLAVGLQGGDLAATARAQLEVYVPRLVGMISHRPPAPPTPLHASAAPVRPPDLRAEVSAEIAAAVSGRR